MNFREDWPLFLITVVLAALFLSAGYGLRSRTVAVVRVSPPNTEGHCTALLSNGWTRSFASTCILQPGDSVEVAP